MLNRLFVLIGILVILAIGAAFIVPRFIQWGDYRERLQTMASSAFGTEVAIEGDIHLTLLPQPQLVFSKVRVGPAAAPALSVDRVEAEFSLIDFLRDQYKVTALRLDHPVLDFSIGKDGALGSGIAIASGAGQSNVSIANADVIDGTLRLADQRSGAAYAAEAVNGQLRLEAIDGPFSFQGSASVGGTGYGVRVGTGKLGPDGSTTLSFGVKPADGGFSLESQGALQTAGAPRYAGDLKFRMPPPKPKDGEAVDVVRGDFTLDGKIEVTPDKVLLTDYTALPDENRAAIRLTGAADVTLGKAPVFNAVVSGGVVALPPRDATTELTDPPYELVRLLGETPLPPIPPIAGTIGLDISELNLRAVALRDLRLDAATDGHSWSIKDFAAALPGGARLGLTGNLSAVDGKPIFAGGVTLATDRLDTLAALWRKPAADNPLFNMPGSLSADVALSSDTLSLSSGTLVVGGINQGFDAEIGFGQPRRLKLDTHFTSLGPEESAAIAALLPDVAGSGSFGATFPKGELNVSASAAVLFGLQGSDLSASASWEGGVLEFSKLSAGDLGGAAFDAKLTAFGTLAKPELSGTANLHVSDGAPVLAALLSTVSTPPAVTQFLTRSLPADLRLQLDAPAGDGGQTLNVSGTLGTADASLTAKLTAGIAAALSAPISASLDLRSGSPHLMTAQLGLGDAQLFDDRTPLHMTASVEGVPSNSYETHVLLEGGTDHIGFDGNVVPGDFTRITGDGQFDVALADPSALAESLGAGGVYVPPVSGKALVHFSGLDSVTLSNIDAGGVSGELSLSRRGDVNSFSGALTVPAMDIHALLPALAGPASTSVASGLWPDGPLDIGSAARSSEGRIDVSAASLTNGGAEIVKDARFGLDWDAQSVRLRGLTGSIGGGTLTLDAALCCSNGLAGKQVSGRLALSGVSIDALAPAPIGAELDGTLDASAAFDGTGETLAQAIAAMTGTGSYTISGFSAASFDPATFRDLGGLTGVLNTTPEALTDTVTQKLAAAPFVAPSVTGSFTIAGGVLRSPNLAIVGTDARIFGGANLSLADLSLDGRYAMTPTGIADPGSAIDATAEVAADIKGPLWAPAGSYDVAALVDAMKIKASEIELAVLEQRKADADARAREQADIDARLKVLQSGQGIAVGGQAQAAATEAAAQKAAAELAAKQKADADAAAARKAAADAAAKKAAADAAAKKAAADAASSAAASDLGM